MTHFTNINVHNNNLHFELNNNDSVKLSLANAIRRIAIAEVPTFSLSNIDFQENSSMLHNAFLEKRLELIPLNYLELNKYNLDKLKVSLDITNDTVHMLDVTTKNFVVKNDMQTIENIIVDDNILFGKLKPNQTIKFTTNIKKSNAKLDGSYYTPVCKSTVSYKKDDKAIQELLKEIPENKKENFLKVGADQLYLKTKSGEPQVYLMDIESIGSMEPKMILTLSLNILKEKLEIVRDAVKEDIENKVNVDLSDRLYQSYNFMIIDEDHTLGNFISSYLLDHPQIDYAGYIIPHPNDNKLLITTTLKNDNTLDGNKKVFVEIVQNLIELVEKLREEWKSANSVKPVSKKIRIKKKA